MRKWVIADTHFGHANIIKSCDRPFKTVEEMDETLISNWNSVVNKREETFVVGDFALSNKPYIKSVLTRLKGKKTLIMGNHCRHKSPAFWRDVGFDEVMKYPIIIDDFYIFSHEPIFLNETMPYANIFGHVHKNIMYKDYTKQSFCVSVERINYTPIDFETIKKTISNLKC